MLGRGEELLLKNLWEEGKIHYKSIGVDFILPIFHNLSSSTLSHHFFFFFYKLPSHIIVILYESGSYSSY